MNSSQWEKNQLDREENTFKDSVELEKDLNKDFEDTKQKILSDIALLIGIYAIEKKLIYQQTTKYVNPKEFEKWKNFFKNTIKKYYTKDENLEKKKMLVELEMITNKKRAKRIEITNATITANLVKYSDKFEKKLKNRIINTYKTTYKSLAKDLGIKKTLSDKAIKNMLEMPFAGSNFSKRIWGNTDKLATILKKEMTNNLIRGIDPQKMIKNIAKKMDHKNINDVKRLVRTELNNALNTITLNTYKTAGIKEYKFLAILDSRTSQVCTTLNGNIFKVENAIVGINYPPMHPNCRSTTVQVEF